LQDNFSGHIVPPNLQCIQVENFEPNLTAHIQPNDQGIIRCFKAHYHSQFIQQAVDHYDEGITPSQIYEINQLQAMRIADAVWHNVDTTTIRNCWHRAGSLLEITTPSLPVPQPIISISALLHNSSSQMDPIQNVEKQVEAMLDDLVATGALQNGNHMDIESLLNPPGESQTLTEASDKEIYQAVMDARGAHNNLEINGGDDIDEVVPLEPQPTHIDVHKAISVISKYIDDINNPLAGEEEAVLSSFNRQLWLEEAQITKETAITDYFSKY
jgi:hypothetical protein